MEDRHIHKELEITESENLHSALKISYEVRGKDGTDFDVYLFEEGYNSGFNLYKEYMNGEDPEDHPTGRKGISDENADGLAEATPSPIQPGTYHFVVDYSDYGSLIGGNGFNGAEVDNDDPEELTVDVNVLIEDTGIV